MCAPCLEMPHAIILAAGHARRFGAPKLLAMLEGRPVIRHVSDAVAGALAQGVLGAVHLVCRADDAALRDQVPAEWCVAIDASSSSMSASLRAGVSAAAAAGAAAVVLCLADQPRLRVATLAALVACWRDGAIVARPVYAEEPQTPGHPLLLDRTAFHLVEHTEGDRGLDPVLHRLHVPIVPVLLPGRHPDLDTPDDLSRL